MKRNLIWVFVIAFSMLSSDLRADTVVFDFDNDTAFDDNAAAGATMSAMGETDTVVATSVGVFAPEFIEPMPGVFELSGATIEATTTIASGNDSIGVSNPSITNGDFETFTGVMEGTESTDFNFGQSFVIEFDTDVIIQEFNFSSIDDDGGFFIVEVEGVATPFNFANGTPSDDFDDPFEGMVIPAGTDITFSVGGSQAASVRISEITVETVATSTLIGDVNLDEMVNFLDISPFIIVLGMNESQAEADINEDGEVNFLDISPFIVLLSTPQN